MPEDRNPLPSGRGAITDSMVERVARALNPDAFKPLSEFERENGLGAYWEHCRVQQERHAYRQARAAIEAMREPGLAIRKLTTFEFAEIEWPRLIDAALSEEPK